MNTLHEHEHRRFDESGDIYKSGYFCSSETFPETNVICEIFVNLKETPSQLRGTNKPISCNTTILRIRKFV